jgi:SAM-dependent methyltransferase
MAPHPQSGCSFGTVIPGRPYRLRLARYKALAETVVDFLAARPGGEFVDLLDLGVGSGRVMCFLDAEGVADRIRFHAVDRNPRRIERIYAPERWRITQADLDEDLPLGDCAFDIVVCEQVIEHLSSPEHALREAARVLRPGGLLILGAPTFPPFLAAVRPPVIALRERLFGVARTHFQSFTSRRLLNLVSAVGAFERISARGVRILSGGPLAPLENYAWWYRLNRRLGAALPSLCVETQIVACRRAAAPRDAAA